MSIEKTIEELKASIAPVMEGFEELKKKVEASSKKTDDAMKEFDAFDKASFDKISKSVNELLEKQEQITADLAAKAKTQEDLEKALNRLAHNSENPEQKAKELQEKRTDLFNKFSKSDNENKESFYNFMKRNVEDEKELKALSTISDPDGGYLVMPQFGGIINAKIFETSPMRQLATVENVSTDQYELITDNDEATCGWVGETASRSTTNTPQLGKIIIPVNEMYANPKSTQKMLDDGIVDVEAWLAQKVADKFARTEATAFITGNGVLKPKGIMSYDAGTDISLQQVEQINTGSTTGYTYDGLVEIQNALKEAYQAGAVWLLKRASNVKIMTIKDGENRPIFNMNYDKNAGLTPTILGKPAFFANDVASVAENALSIAYGDFGMAYRVLDRQGVRVLRDPFTDKPNVAFYTTKRVGGAVVNFEAYKIGKNAA